MTVVLNSTGLRPARFEDGYVLWLWSNDALTRRWSGHRSPIHIERHMAWLAQRLADPSALLLLAEDEESVPVGSVRFETTTGWQTARLSYVVAPRFRGQGRSRALVNDAMRRLTEVHPAAQVWAEVLQGNEASLKVFRGLQWAQAPIAAGDKLTFWWRP
jgi:RimJ/RimL family protein N-acetyltransferase